MPQLARKLLAGVALALVALVVAAVSYLFVAFPRVGPAPELKIEGSAEQVARGRYLAHHVAVCIDCHSQRDWTRLAAPPVPGTEGQGGEVFDERMGFPGSYHASNITPAAVGDWSDGELYRAITQGVGRGGRPLFPVMPYRDYGQLTDEDIHAIIAYVRTLEPLQHAVPVSRPSFPMSLIIRTLPGRPSRRLFPDGPDSLARGRYLTIAAGCLVCHTPQQRGEPVAGREGAGGFDFLLPTGLVRSSNITPHEVTGIGGWTREQFILRFKLFAGDAAETPLVGPGELQTPMPWTMYAGMSEADLAAIYDYLRSLPPLDNRVETFRAASDGGSESGS